MAEVLEVAAGDGEPGVFGLLNWAQSTPEAIVEALEVAADDGETWRVPALEGGAVDAGSD